MASKRRLRRKACLGKQRFATREDALRAVLSLRRRRAGVGWLTPYLCQFCHHFHVGHPPVRVRQSIAAQQRADPFYIPERSDRRVFGRAHQQ